MTSAHLRNAGAHVRRRAEEVDAAYWSGAGFHGDAAIDDWNAHMDGVVEETTRLASPLDIRKRHVLQMLHNCAWRDQ